MPVVAAVMIFHLRRTIVDQTCCSAPQNLLFSLPLPKNQKSDNAKSRGGKRVRGLRNHYAIISHSCSAQPVRCVLSA